MTRRELIKTGAGGVLLLNLAACAAAPRDDRRIMLRAIAAAMLAGALPADGYERALDAAVEGTETAIAGLPPAVVREVEQLLALLLVPLSRAFVAGVRPSWSRASREDVDAFLERWRTSGVLLFRSGYQALHQLVLAGWYGGDASWPATGYAGPPRIT